MTTKTGQEEGQTGLCKASTGVGAVEYLATCSLLAPTQDQTPVRGGVQGWRTAFSLLQLQSVQYSRVAALQHDEYTVSMTRS